MHSLLGDAGFSRRCKVILLLFARTKERRSNRRGLTRADGRESLVVLIGPLGLFKGGDSYAHLHELLAKVKDQRDLFTLLDPLRAQRERTSRERAYPHDILQFCNRFFLLSVVQGKSETDY